MAHNTPTADTIKTIIGKIRKKGYLKGQYTGAKAKGDYLPKVDRMVVNLFVDAGAAEVIRLPTGQKPILQQIAEMPDFAIMAQPFGANSNPDFIIRVNGHYVNIEMKSRNGGAKLCIFNSAVPKITTIYLLSTERHGNTHFMGSAIISQKKRDAFLERRVGHFEMSRANMEYYAELDGDDPDAVPTTEYPRIMWGYRKDHFAPAIRAKDEAGVMAFVDTLFTLPGTGLYKREDDLEEMVIDAE